MTQLPVSSHTWIASLPQLDVHTLSEEWLLSMAMQETWTCLAESIGLRPSDWRDAGGARMYAAALALTTWFDLDHPLTEDEPFTTQTRLVSVRKPHALAQTQVTVAGRTCAGSTLLVSFVRRETAGSNKKFSKVRDVWLAADHAPDTIDALLQRHHEAKTLPALTDPVLQHEVNRITDFNAADLFYFRNFVRVAKAAEWKANRGHQTRLNAERTAFYFGNADDGDLLHAAVGRQGDDTVTELTSAAGQRLFLSLARTPPVTIAVR